MAGKTTQNAFDANGNLLSTTDPSGSVFGFEYDENEQQTITTSTVTTAKGVETVRLEKVYDTLNRVTEQIDADGLSTSAEYDALGRQTATIDKLGNRSEISYDARNLPTKQVGPDGRSSSSEYDAAGRMISQTDVNGKTTQHEYDEVGNVTKVTNADGTFAEHEYDALGRLVGTTSSTGLSTSREYDKAGRLIAETDVLGRVTRYEYYADGKRKTMTDPRGNVFAFEYDARGHQTAMRFPDGSRVSYEYNEQGKKIAETDQLGRTTRFEWNDLGLLKAVVNPLNKRTRYSYNEIGNLLSQTDANGYTTSFEYNKLGRRVKKTYPLGMSQTTSYDVQNKTVSVTDFNGETTTSQYDNLGRVVTTSFPDGSSQSYSYSSSGQVASVSGLQGSSRYSYDSDGRLLSVTDPNGATVSYAYDALGRKQTVTAPSGTTDYGYDDYGRLTNVTDADGNETRYTYDEHGNKASTIYPNGTLTEYGYDTLNRLISIETRTISGVVLASYSYTLNSKGQRTHAEEGAGGQVLRSIDYEYDAADRLIEERISDPALGNRTITYEYDPVGNRLTKTDNGVITEYSYDNNDRLLTENGYAYTYDNNGNMLTKSGNGENWQLEYNALNQVTRANISRPQGSSVIDYAYDHDGIRIGKTVNGTEITNYVVDKNRPYAQVLEEEHLSGGLSAVTSYVYGDALISGTIDGTLTHYYHTDGMGSVRGLSDSSGVMTDAYSYDAYGMIQHHNGTSENPYLYRGEQYDSALDSYYLRARYYQPGTGRFLTTDPEEGFPGDPLSGHRYLYGYGNPVDNIDPSGKTGVLDTAITVGILANLLPVGLEYAAIVHEDFGDSLAGWLPDAALIEFSGTLSTSMLRWLYAILNPSPLSLALNLDVGIVFGLDLLFSISSAQYGAYLYWGPHVDFSISPDPNSLVNASVTVSQGWVWNLWNTDNYLGPFTSVNIGVGPHGGISLFKDAINPFKWGAFGMASPMFTYPPNASLSVGWAGTMYGRNVLKMKTYDFSNAPGGMFEVATNFMVYQLAVIAAAVGSQNTIGTVTSIGSLSWPMTISIAKDIWNRRRPEWNVEQRRAIPRPPDFTSGPTGGWKIL